MAVYVVLGFLSAFGTLCLLWTAAGWLLPASPALTLVCVGQPGPEELGRYHWLKGMGFLRGPLICVAEEQPREIPEDLEICSPEELASRLKQEIDQRYGTGTGDSSGCHRSGGLSEL